MAENVDCEIQESKKKPKKEPGIIYFSRIPTSMNVTILRKHFESFGEVGRVFLQPDVKAKSRGKRGRIFSEGWVEFRNKRIAKKVASGLNNTQIGGKQRCKWREELWNIKYLHRFKWGHLNERLAYEKAVHTQRMRTEISQAKREADFHIQNMEKQQHIEKRKSKQKRPKSDTYQDSELMEVDSEKTNVLKLKNFTDDIPDKKTDKKFNKGSRKLDAEDEKQGEKKKKAFLSKIFSAGLDVDNDDDAD